MILYSKNTNNSSIEVYLTYPEIIWKKKSSTFRKGSQEDTKINVNLFSFKLTTQVKYFILEIGVIFGIGIKVIDKE